MARIKKTKEKAEQERRDKYHNLEYELWAHPLIRERKFTKSDIRIFMKAFKDVVKWKLKQDGQLMIRGLFKITLKTVNTTKTERTYVPNNKKTYNRMYLSASDNLKEYLRKEDE